MTTKVPYLLLDQPQLKFVDIASAATVNLDAAIGAYGQITGTTTITAITLSEGKAVWARFTGALTLTHGATLVLQTAANIVTAAGDWAMFVKISSAVYALFYTKANGAPLVAAISSNDLPAGSAVQTVNTQTGAVATGTTILPFDDTIPQITEGNEYMTLAVTPKSATNKLRIDVTVFLSSSVANQVLTAALFRDAGADALAVMAHQEVTGNFVGHVHFTHYMDSPGTSATTFRVRCGSQSAGTITFNGAASARYFGGALTSSITITEIKV